jgi:RimJ/RimL family protein N-acetyltransferase
MIRGKNVTLRTVRENDLDNLFAFLSDITNRGEYFPIMIPSEAIFKKDFRETGFWQEGFGRLLICDKTERIVGSVWYFKAASYYDGLEIGYHMFDVGSRNKGLMTEALALLVRYLFTSKKINRLQLTVMLPNVASRRVASNLKGLLEAQFSTRDRITIWKCTRFCGKKLSSSEWIGTHVQLTLSQSDFLKVQIHEV